MCERVCAHEVILNLHVQVCVGVRQQQVWRAVSLCSIWRGARQDAGACAYWVITGVSLCICVCVCVCVRNQHVSSVCLCVRASVSQALISLCLCVISPELAALKHQRETSALCVSCLHPNVCVCVCVCV